MERELVPSKTLAQNVQNPLGILEIRKRHDDVFGETDKGTFPLKAWFHLILEPLIQHMMQEMFDSCRAGPAPFQAGEGLNHSRDLYRDLSMIHFATARRRFRTWLAGHRIELGLSLRVTISALLALAASHLLHLPIPRIGS
jgi:hypothetical protein